MGEFIPERTWNFPNVIPGGLTVVQGFDGFALDEWRAVSSKEGDLERPLVSAMPCYAGEVRSARMGDEQPITTFIEVQGIRPSPDSDGVWPLEVLGVRVNRVKKGEADPHKLQVPPVVLGFMALTLCCLENVPELQHERAKLEVPVLQIMRPNANPTQQTEGQGGLEFCGFKFVEQNPHPPSITTSLAIFNEAKEKNIFGVSGPHVLDYQKQN